MKGYRLIINEGIGFPDLEFKSLIKAKKSAYGYEACYRIIDMETAKTVYRGYGYLADRL